MTKYNFYLIFIILTFTINSFGQTIILKTLCEDGMLIPFVRADLLKNGNLLFNGTTSLNGDLKFKNIGQGEFKIITKNADCINDTILISLNSEKDFYSNITLTCKICNEAYSNPILENLNRRITTDTANAFAYFDRGEYFLKHGKYLKALEDFDRAIKIKPEFAEAYNERANTKRDANLESFPQILEDYNKAIAINHKLSKAYYDRGVAKNYFESNHQPTAGCSDICKAYDLGYPQQLKVFVNNCECMKSINK